MTSTLPKEFRTAYWALKNEVLELDDCHAEKEAAVLHMLTEYKHRAVDAKLDRRLLKHQHRESARQQYLVCYSLCISYVMIYISM